MVHYVLNLSCSVLLEEHLCEFNPDEIVFPQSHDANTAKRTVYGRRRYVINYFCGISVEITAAHRSHFSFKRWSGPGCKGQLSESLYPPKATGGL